MSALGYEEPTPVQRETIPLLLAGRDVLGPGGDRHRQDGRVRAADAAARSFRTPRPARTPAASCSSPRASCRCRSRRPSTSTPRASASRWCPSTAARRFRQQIRTLERGAGIVVATPGRALDHIRRGTLKLDHLRMLVLDEADEMLDMGFAEDLDAILEATPKTRQTALFSATMPSRILSIAQRHLNNPARVTIAREKTAAGKLPRVRQVAYIVPRAHKPAALDRVLDMENPTSALVFCRTRLEVETLVETLSAHGRRAQALHGGMEQRQRDRVMQMFRGGKADLLVATDVAARGLDIEHLSHVVNYDVPASARGVRPPDRPHRARGPRRHGHHARGAARTSPAAHHRGLHEAEDRRRHGADRGRAPRAAAGRDERLASASGSWPGISTRCASSSSRWRRSSTSSTSRPPR